MNCVYAMGVGGGQVCSFECCVKFLMVVLSVQCAASWRELACFAALDRLLFLRNTQQSQHLSLFKTCLSTPVLYETACRFCRVQLSQHLSLF